jgi:hypothetical protein
MMSSDAAYPNKIHHWMGIYLGMLQVSQLAVSSDLKSVTAASTKTLLGCLGEPHWPKRPTTSS